MPAQVSSSSSGHGSKLRGSCCHFPKPRENGITPTVQQRVPSRRQLLEELKISNKYFLVDMTTERAELQIDSPLYK
ncbi:hypothetical protein AVEN_195493-1 [Araneus ventricosus]|uniref:Uncharacterized protein n=1 Tax=Araneus ventricosus TaxID=182803 RepID=A0A4Y2K436_ARAVE|nr:hypothetical protein AVEN_195493-1 [Araneus ventricosus]